MLTSACSSQGLDSSLASSSFVPAPDFAARFFPFNFQSKIPILSGLPGLSGAEESTFNFSASHSSPHGSRATEHDSPLLIGDPESSGIGDSDPVGTVNYPHRLTLPDSTAYSPFRDSTPHSCERPLIQLLRSYNKLAEDRFQFMARGNFGERLKREREMREVSMDELTKTTRISKRFLQALENEDWEKLPGGVFGHGFIRSIARYLGLDEEGLLAEYDLARSNQSQAALAKPEEHIPSLPKWIPVAAVLAILLVLIGLFYAGRYGWRRYTAYRAAKKSTSSLVAQPQSQAGSTSLGSNGESSGASLLDLSVSTSAATRVRVLADNKLLLDAELPAGETRHFSASQQFEVAAGDSSAVLLEMNGQAMPPLGSPGASGTIVLSQKDLRQASGGNSQP